MATLPDNNIHHLPEYIGGLDSLEYSSESDASEVGPRPSESTSSSSSVMPRSSPNESERTSSCSDNDLPLDIATEKSEIPVQPKICFPSRLFGASGRSFQAHWYKEFPWIEYSVDKKMPFSVSCVVFSTCLVQSQGHTFILAFMIGSMPLGSMEF